MSKRKLSQTLAGDYEDDAWSLTVMRISGQRIMRPNDKLWRPVVSVEVDKHHGPYETQMGCDGQNPNRKECHLIRDVSLKSQVDITVSKKSQSKKKRKNILVASAQTTMNELWKKQQGDRKELDLRLHCQSASRRGSTSSARGKPQNGAVIHLHLRPPSNFTPPPINTEFTASSSGASSSATLTGPSSPDTEEWSPSTPIDAEGLRKRLKGYSIDSLESDLPPFVPDPRYLDDIPVEDEDSAFSTRDTSPAVIRYLSRGPLAIAASLLPTYSEAIKVPDELNSFEQFISKFTYYRQLKLARGESDFDVVYEKLSGEWKVVGTVLGSLAAINTTAYTITPDSIFNISYPALCFAATSNVAAAVGLALNAWYLFRYYWAGEEVFRTRVRDVFESYTFFSIWSRIPLFCLIVTGICLLCFVILVAFDTFPSGAIWVCFLIGFMAALQFLAFGLHLCYKKVAAVILRRREDYA